MNNLLQNRIQNIFSRDVLSSFFNQLWRIVSGPMTLILIPIFLTAEVQGFWYTFISISALSIFADLGFTTIVGQFAAHEFAFLKFDVNFKISGLAEYHNRLSSLFHFILKWLVLVVCIVFPIVFIIGYILFIQKAEVYVWILPWIIYTIGAVFAFINGVISSFIQGCGQVSNIQKIGLRVAIFRFIVVITGLYFRTGLYALSLAMIGSNLYFSLLIIIKYRFFLLNLLKREKVVNNWSKDILGLLWKYAISWSSGYFIFQIYTPLMFQFHGAVEAGKVGITMSMVTAIFGISNIWFTANTPKMNMFVAKKEWNLLDNEFRKNLIFSVATYIIGFITLFILIIFFRGRIALFDRILIRFLGFIPVVMLITCRLFSLIVSGMATYLRAHKKEPYFIPSFVSGIFILFTTYYGVKYLAPEFIFVGFLLSWIFLLPWAYGIFRKKQREWHN